MARSIPPLETNKAGFVGPGTCCRLFGGGMLRAITLLKYMQQVS